MKLSTHFAALLWLTLAVFLLPSNAKAQEAWAEYDEDSETLTFKYGTEKPNTTEKLRVYALNEGTSKPAWYGTVSMKKVVFDTSFDTLRPTTCYYWFGGQAGLEKIEGIEYLHTDSVTNMERMFYGCDALNELDLSRFNTKCVTTMKRMFYSCDALKSVDLSNIVTDNVSSMERMFYSCDLLESVKFPATAFITASGCTTEQMFYGCKSLQTLDLSGFNTGNVSSMEKMFYECTALTTLDLSGFNTGNVSSMEQMFYGCTALETVKFPSTTFGTASGCTTKRMFYGCTALKTLDLSKFNTENVTKTNEMFYNCKSLQTLDISGFNTGNVSSMAEMFYGCEALETIKFPTVFNTASDGCSMSQMFYNCKSLQTLDISGFNTESVTYMDGMFNGCEALKAIDFPSTFSTANVGGMEYMFAGCKSLKTLDLSGFNTGYVGTWMRSVGTLEPGSNGMTGMFYGCEALESIKFSPAFNTTDVYDMGGMFCGCQSLKSLDLSSFNTAKVGYMEYMFSGCSSLTELDVSGFKTGQATDMSFMFENCSSLTSLDVKGFYTGSVTNMTSMFKGCRSLTSLDVSEFYTTEAYGMESMFEECVALTSIDVSEFITAKVTGMKNMFAGCLSLTSLDLHNFATDNVEDMSGMFSACNGLTTIYANEAFTTANVTSADNMFSGCVSLNGAATFDRSKTGMEMANTTDGYFTYKKDTRQPWAEYDSITTTLTFYCGDKPSTFGESITPYDLNNGTDIPGWYDDHSADITKVVFDASFDNARPTSTAAWFFNMQKLTQIEGLEYLHTDNVRTMNAMFYNCDGLTELDLSGFNTEKLTFMPSMFYECDSLAKLDLSSFSTDRVEYLAMMFACCAKLATIYVSDKFKVPATAESPYMFYACNSLKGAVAFDANNSTDATMANYTDGYFKTYYKTGDTKHELAGANLSVTNLVLEDGKDFVAHAPFKAATASYSRAMTSKWGTLCLPFTVETTSMTDYSFYGLQSVTGDVITLTKLNGTIDAGTPVLVYSDNGLDISADNVEVVTTPSAGTQASGWQLVGSYAETEVPDDGYIISKNKFWLTSNLKSSAKVKAVKTKGLRAWLKSDAGSSEAKAQVLDFALADESVPTAIEAIDSLTEGSAEIYDTLGRRTDRLQKGVNIVRTGGVTRKVMVK